MLRVEKVSDDEITLIVSGSLYGEAGVDFEKRMETLSEGPYPLITLDLSMTLGITSSAIGKLLAIHRKLSAQNRKIRIAGCHATIYSVFTKIKLDTLIDIRR